MNAFPLKYYKKDSIITALFICLYSLCLLLIAIYAYRRPLYNWDMLGYIALVIQKTHKDVNEIHQKTYSSVKEVVPETNYTLQIAGNERRKRWAAYPNEFYSILPFYAIKPAYVELVNLAYKMGCSLPIATVLPSILAYILIGFLVFYWLAKYLKFLFAFLVSLFIMYSEPLISLARLSTPDALSALLLLFSFYFIIERPSLKWIFFSMALSIFTRLDNIIPCVCILSFLFLSKNWQNKMQLKSYIIMLSAFIVFYFGITTATLKPFGWNVFYYPTFIRHVNLSGIEYSHFSLAGYLELLYSRLITSLLHFNVPLFLLFLLFLLLPSDSRFRKFTFAQQLSLLLGVLILLKFILFPDLSDRFNISYYLVFIILFAKRYKNLLSMEPNQPNHLKT
ncbi:hypothetical protein [Terrimonas alba]|uniref:hypothetical protein n=1 Tax=Terrimonas alba TaxID=3349636 RepID=UPI0035F36B86